MRKLAILFAVSFSLLAQAGSPDTVKAFEDLTQTKSHAAMDAYRAKDYSSAIKLSQDIVDAYNALAADEKKREIAAIQSTFYNLACFSFVAGKEEKGFEWLKTAVDSGYKNYFQMKVDSDFSSVRGKPEFEALLDRVRKVGDYQYLLQQSGAYAKEETAKPTYEYENASDERLKEIRAKYNLDMVAGKGDDVSQVLRLMRWVHLTVNHDGSNMPAVHRNAEDLIAYAAKEHKGINCRCMSITLNDCYLAMGFKSHYVTCMPKDADDPDCHVIDSVYVPSLHKWVWMDASFCGYFKDEKGTLLSIEEVRDRVINDKPLVASPELEWNGQVYTADNYRNYMSKNMYWFSIAVKSETDYETSRDGHSMDYIHLIPSGWKPGESLTHLKDSKLRKNTFTNDSSYFWQAPSGK